MKPRIKILNVGPLSTIEFEINQVNLIIGEQSSGKSTIAKVISYCQWVEKRMMLDGEFKYDVWEQLVDFHRLTETYFRTKSLIEYESDHIHIVYKGKKLNNQITLKDGVNPYQKTKNIYVPSERNFVSSIPNLNKYNETNDNLMSFVFDWHTAKRNFTSEQSLPILNLDLNYYYDKEDEKDYLNLGKSQNSLPLNNSSSGIQSITPLIVMIEYLTNHIYKNLNKPNSVFSIDNLAKFLVQNMNQIIGINKIEVKSNKDLIRKLNQTELKKLIELYINRGIYNRTNFIIEEPEQNLFPSTQKDFIYYLFNKVISEREHGLIITTHSPFILYAINNCMFGYLIFESLKRSERKSFNSFGSWIDPNNVSLFEVESKKGTLVSIKDARTGTLGKHYFNENMNEIMNEYYNMLSYYEPENKSKKSSK